MDRVGFAWRAALWMVLTQAACGSDPEAANIPLDPQPQGDAATTDAGRNDSPTVNDASNDEAAAPSSSDAGARDSSSSDGATGDDGNDGGTRPFENFYCQPMPTGMDHRSFRIKSETLEVEGRNFRRTPSGLEVWTGYYHDVAFDYLSHVENVAVVTNPSTGNQFLFLQTYNREIWQYGNVLHDTPGRAQSTGDFFGGKAPPAPPPPISVPPRTPTGVDATTEKDDCGNVAIDVLILFSSDAAAIVGDTEAFAELQLESDNMALRNSWDTGIRLRLAGVEIATQTLAVTVPAVDQDVPALDQQFASKYNQDIITYLTKSSSDDTAGGWGNSSNPPRAIAAVDYSPPALRHEIGHTVGIAHCRDDANAAGFAFGYDNGFIATIMCGNSSMFWSNPIVKDAAGRPLGVADKQDDARTWLENAVKISKHRKKP